MHVVLMAVIALGALALPAAAQPREARPEGVGEPLVIRPESGFVDDAMALDSTGSRLVWVRSDEQATIAEVHVVDLATGKDLAVFDLVKKVRRVRDVHFAGKGEQELVIVGTTGDLGPGERPVTAHVTVAGKVLRTWPAFGQLVVDRGEELLVFGDTLNRKPRWQGHIVWQVKVVKLASGKPFGKGAGQFETDTDGLITRLQLDPIVWQDGWLRLRGKRRGQYDRKLDQRQPDTDAVYDVISGKIVKDTVIADLQAHALLMDLRGRHPNTAAILWVNQKGNLELVTADDRRLDVGLALPFSRYLAPSLVVGEGTRAFTLAIDPVNPDAVKAQKADPIHVDLYFLDAQTGKATRQARLPGGGDVRWRAVPGRWAILRKHKGFDRGGPQLDVYPLLAK
jgi:hypothetical protein